jgi:hypothetical protein
VSDELAHDVLVKVSADRGSGATPRQRRHPAAALAAVVPKVTADGRPAPFDCFA